MPSPRRMRFYGILVVITVVVLLYMTNAAHHTQTSDFYTKTQQALQEREHEEAAKRRDAESVQSRLKAAEEQAKKSADDKYTSVKEAVEGPARKGVAGRVAMDSQDDKKVPGVAAQGGRTRDQAAMKKDETLEDHEVEMAMNAILKQSPVIIFSKSHCPYSKKAKHILLEKYRILPEPFVVELDKEPLGDKLQALLAHMTGRRTVPNILLIGKSIGGGDDMEELDQTDTLVATFNEIGGTRITDVEHRNARPEIRRLRRA
ncbi:thioredoxin-like protein [Ampelomyces quisqualis]|uniref:Thioredoxin-like protein n=1 Tax=Ampelomyces quisqualis TaxID=50730 RepID=A0A6A5QYN2_AMPQU|nr:thioredoxin-like protein [Ampelomyces quisqualis]